MLRNRWIVRPTTDSQPGRPNGAAYCVECRATCAVIFWGTRAACRRAARARNGAR